jgi:dTDP-4-dehydrorhamnose 3,5-epimerase
MQVVETEIPAVKLIKPQRHIDTRGFFSEVFREDALQEYRMRVQLVQDNHSLSSAMGVIRGLHFQTPPFAQAKLLRVTSGAVFDVAVDIRWGSQTFGRHIAAVLSASRVEPDLGARGVRARVLYARA